MSEGSFELLAQQPTSFAVSVGGLTRWDVGYSLARASSQPIGQRRRLGDLLVDVRYGTSGRATPEPLGTPILRMGNIQDHGWDLRDLKYLKLTSAERPRYLLESGDVLVNRTNTEDLVGKAAVWREPGEWGFASYLIRLRVNTDELDSEFLAAWLNSRDARDQIEKVSRRSAGQTNISGTDLRGLELPAVPLGRQKQLARQLERARLLRESRVASIRSDLAAVRLEVAQSLGLPIESASRPLWTVVPREDLSSTKRLDVNCYHPDRARAANVVRANKHSRIGNVCEIVRDQLSTTSMALGLGAVQSNTGRLTPESSLEPVDQVLGFSANDVLLARLRPALNKVWLADRMGFCSPEFLVLRTSGIDPRYLAAVLRCWFVVDQLQWAATGNTHPRLPDEDLLEALVPRTTPQLEREIGEDVVQSIFNAEIQEADAEHDWISAKAEFNAAVQGAE